MRDRGFDLQLAVEAASDTVSKKADSFEIFCRFSKNFQLTTRRRGPLLRSETAELGVACRVQKGPLVGFGRASGSASEAGRQAAELALASLSLGHEPLPPAYQLGAVPVPPRLRVSREDAANLFEKLAQDPARKELTVTLATAETMFFRSEGFSARFQNQLLVAEWQQEVLAGVVVTFRRAARQEGDLAAPSLLKMVAEDQPLASLRLEHGLRRVLLAPDVAAPLLVSLARHRAPAKTLISPAWGLWDLRQGEEAFLPMACDGEGYPARNLPILVGESSRGFAGNPQPPVVGPSRGAVRVPWDALPAPNPVHLWQQVSNSLPWDPGTFDGVMALAPVSEVVLEGGGRFRLLALTVEVHRGNVLAQGVVVLSGSLSRLPHALVATFGPQEHVALGCVVSAPWMLFKNLEVR